MKVNQDRDWARWALERWSGFPVTTEPRPLVLVGSETQMDEGFRSGAAKLAFLAGAVDGDASVPLGVLALLRTRDVKGATDLAKGARLMVGDAHLSETD